jgi:molecular chaperone HtpG
LQNAYDAVLMRCTAENLDISSGLIRITVEPRKLTIIDNGIGMNEATLRNNFWNAGSSGKKSELARKAGVIGTFGIGAMANFGVCSRLRVETRSIDSDVTLISTAERSKLSISQNCIDLERVSDNRDPGTTLIADLDNDSTLASSKVKEYLAQYIAYLPVRVLQNDEIVSQQSYMSILTAKQFEEVASRTFKTATIAADLTLYIERNAKIAVILRNLKIQGVAIEGEMVLVQEGGQLMGLRNYFGLAPVPFSAHYQFGGIANLAVLQPTAGREALSRESIERVSAFINLAEDGASALLAATEFADRNSGFLQYVSANKRNDLAGSVAIQVLPDDKQIPLGQVLQYAAGQSLQYYTGTDQSIIDMFAHQHSLLLHTSQANPRRQVQLRYIQTVLQIPAVPDRATLKRVYKPTELTIEEASFLARIGQTLSEDYLLPNTDIMFAEISHGVAVLVEQEQDLVKIYLARNNQSLQPVLATYRSAYEVFAGFVKDFVRNHLYSRLSQYVPSSTKQGADALAKLLQRNRELYRYEESDLGELEPLLADYLSGEKTLAQVIVAARSVGRPQTQFVRSDQVGSLEQALPDVVDSPSLPEEPPASTELSAAPPILRQELNCNLKILIASAKHRQLNNFELFLGLSDRLMRREGDFFHWPHTTKVMWGGHRVIYIFTEASGKITLYYDIELKEPLDQQTASGGAFPTTTIITKNRIFIPVPEALAGAFRIEKGSKEFFVRFDTVTN